MNNSRKLYIKNGFADHKHRRLTLWVPEKGWSVSGEMTKSLS